MREPDVRAIVQQALDYDSTTERAAFIDRACAGYPHIRARVDTLLKALDDAGAIKTPAESDKPPEGSQDDPTAIHVSPPGAAPAESIATLVDDPVGTRIGPYKLLQPLGEGGMGVVYAAQQDHPVRRTVALKLIKAGMDTKQVIARFEAERQALALMSHPNIASVLDAGATEQGRPYFVMELVKGVPITKYCDDARLSPEARLSLFLPVCAAIQHAHQKGIIHRDIKPSNVLVTLVDGEPVPKVIDFGIAKAIDQRLTERTLFTQHGAIVGTPEYMSPEQAEVSNLDIDTRSDIYSLGVLLYELLTGSTPLDRETLRRAAYAEIVRRIKEEEPPRPSTRLSGSADKLASIAAVRHTEPAKLTKLVRGDLDWIVMKALEKDRGRRYESANAFAKDIRRYLEGDPIEARAPSRAYRLRKFARKHRVWISTAAIVALVLIAATIFSAWQMFLARKAETTAKTALAETSKAKKDADAALARSEEERTLSDAVANLLIEGFRRSEPSKDGRDLKVVDVLDGSMAKVRAGLGGSPRIKGRMLDALGRTYLGLGLPERAEEALRAARRLHAEAVGPYHFDTLATANAHADAILLSGRADEAIRLREETIKLWDEHFGPDHPGSLNERNGLAVALGAAGRRPEAVKILEETLARTKAIYGDDHPATFDLRGNLAVAYVETGRRDEGRALNEENVRLRAALDRSDDPSILSARNNLATADIMTGRAAVAIKNLQDLLKVEASKLGADHPTVLGTRNNLAVAYGTVGRWAEAIELLKATADLIAAKSGADHPTTLIARLNLTTSMYNAGHVADSLPILQETIRLQTAKLGADHPNTLQARNNLGTTLNALDRRDEAIAEMEAALKIAAPKLGPDHVVTEAIRANLAVYYQKQGRHADALPLLRLNLERARAKAKPGDPNLADPVNALAAVLLKAKKWIEAEPLLREALKIRETTAPDAWATFATRSMLGEALTGRKKFEAAEPAVVVGYEGLKSREEKIPAKNKVQLADAAARVIALYQAWDKPEKAAEWREKLKPGP